MPVESFKHPYEKRPHIPSQEEEGMEVASPAGAYQKDAIELPRNPIVHRGQDPELFWLGKYGKDDAEDHTRALVRPLYRREHVSPEVMMKQLYRRKVQEQGDLFLDLDEAFGHALGHDELDKVGDYYRHADGWTNRLVLGDSLLVMSSLLEKEGYAGKVQCIYIDPPYGIKYGSNWQIKMNSRDVRDGSDDHLSAEPEQVKAYRDTWELGIHSYLSYLRDRLLVARELLTESGSCFVQISDENVHLVRCLMDEVFGSGNFCGQIIYKKTSGAGSPSAGTEVLAVVADFILWYARDKETVKFRQLFIERTNQEGEGAYTWLELKDGTRRKMTQEEKITSTFPDGAIVFRADNLTSQSGVDKTRYEVSFEGRNFTPTKGVWKTGESGMQQLILKKRLILIGNTLSYVRYYEDFPLQKLNVLWDDTITAGFADSKLYSVQTNAKVIQRCLLMTTDPGDLVLDPTCGSGTTAYVAEQWGRRWITIDTSRIALNIAKTRILSATFPYYHLYDSPEGWVREQEMRAKRGLRVMGEDEKPAAFGHDLRQGFVYRKVPHITLKSLANDLPPEEETLFDQAEVDASRVRVAGPFTVETLQSLDVLSPEDLAAPKAGEEDEDNFMELVFNHLKAAGIRNGLRNETARFSRVEALAEPYFNAQGYWTAADGSEKRALFFIGPRFGTVSKKTVNEAARLVRDLVRDKGEIVDWFVVLGFAFEDGLTERTQDQGLFQISVVRMADDLLQHGLARKDKKAASFVTVGEPDIVANKLENGYVQIEVRGLDIFDPMSGQLKSRDVADISYWYLDEDYDGSNFVTRQIFFCGGDKKEFDDWKKGLDSLASPKAKKKAEAALRIELNDEAWERLYGYKSHPMPPKDGGRSVAVRVVSQFGEESTKVLRID